MRRRKYPIAKDILPIDNIMPAVLGLGTPIKMKRLNPKSLFKIVSSCSDNHLWSVINASGNRKSHFSTVLELSQVNTLSKALNLALWTWWTHGDILITDISFWIGPRPEYRNIEQSSIRYVSHYLFNPQGPRKEKPSFLFLIVITFRS